jgi:xanthine dehydrogenase YagR molybdenum-binding subunit
VTVAVDLDRLVGPSVDRVDGPRKVTGAARYAIDVDVPNLAHASLVRSTISKGRVAAIDTGPARSSPGVLTVITHEDAPKLHTAKRDMIAPPPVPPLQTDEIDHYGQYVAIVVAETPQQADAAAAIVEVRYEPESASLRRDDPGAERKSNAYRLDMGRGDVEDGIARADVVREASYATSPVAHNPIGLFATVAWWDGDRLIVHDATQYAFRAREVLAGTFKMKEHDVQVVSPFVGGAFGAGLRVSPHTILAAVAARAAGRPVKIVLTRPQMFTGIGHRPDTEQHIRVAASAEGSLLAIDHQGSTTTTDGPTVLYPITMGTPSAYACPNVSARDEVVKLDIPPIAHMRGPGEAEGNFALESILDELSYDLGIDPIDLRLRNHADVNPQTGGAWSTKALRECYAVGAERFGWADRSPEPGSMRDGPWQIGYGMAGISYGHNQPEASARVTIRSDGTAHVSSGTVEIGVGTWTVMTQLSAEILGLPIDRVEFELGDTDLPEVGYVGGSGHTIALGSAIHDACRKLVEAFLDLAGGSPTSPLVGSSVDDVRCADGRITRADDPDRGERYVDILERGERYELTADGHSAPPKEEMGTQIKSLIASKDVGRKLVTKSKGVVPAGAFGARFVEVGVDRDLGLLRVRRVVSAIDAGRVINEKTARSQIIGGTIQGIGMAMFEEIITDADTGRIANATFGDYLVPVNADVPDMDVVFVGEPDDMNPIGAKGVGEVGFVGVPAAICNAVYHATGRRLRSLPVTIDQLL